jgi:chromosome segregation ATPase
MTKKTKRHPNTKRATQRRTARSRAVEEAHARHAIDRLVEKRRDIIVEKRQLSETLNRLEHQHEEWGKTIRVLRTQMERLDVEIIVLNTSIGEAQEAVRA